MTPIEIAEYRQRWMRKENYPVKIHSDLRDKAKNYCKVQMMKHQWGFSQFTNVYEDTFYFEHAQDQRAFAHYFKDWLQ